jgi:hypothetical protein
MSGYAAGDSGGSRRRAPSLAGLKASAYSTRIERSNRTREIVMPQESKKGTSDQKIAHTAKVWRQHDKAAIGTRKQQLKDAEYLARQELRKVVDDAERGH